MLRGYRGKRFTPKLMGALLLTLAVAGIGYAVNHGLQQQALYDQEARDAHAEYAKYSRAEIEQSCVALAAPKKAECIRKATPEYEKQENDNRREQADLVAQRTSALWTKIMGLAALIGMALSAVGVWLVKITFDETRNANTIARDAYLADNRAWLVVSDVLASPIGCEIRNGQKMFFFEVSVIIKNIGTSPNRGLKTDIFCSLVYTSEWEAHTSFDHDDCIAPNDTRVIHNEVALAITQDDTAKHHIFLSLAIGYRAETDGEDCWTFECWAIALPLGEDRITPFFIGQICPGTPVEVRANRWKTMKMT